MWKGRRTKEKKKEIEGEGQYTSKCMTLSHWVGPYRHFNNYSCDKKYFRI